MTRETEGGDGIQSLYQVQNRTGRTTKPEEANFQIGERRPIRHKRRRADYLVLRELRGVVDCVEGREVGTLVRPSTPTS